MESAFRVMAPLKASMAAAGVVAGQRGVPVGDVLAVGPLPLAEGVAVDPRAAQAEQKTRPGPVSQRPW